MRLLLILLLIQIASVPIICQVQIEMYLCQNLFDFENDGSIDRKINTSVSYLDDNLILKVDSIDNNSDGIHDQLRKYAFTYNANNNVIQEIYTNDANNDGQVDQSAVKDFIYLNELLIQERYVSNNSFSFTKNNTYDTENHILTTSYLIDFGHDGSIDQSQYFTYQYNLQNFKEFADVKVDHDHNGSIDYVENYSYTYDSLGQMLNELILIDIDNNGSINNSTFTTYSYNNLNLLDTIISKRYKGNLDNLLSQVITTNEYTSSWKIALTVLQEDNNADDVYDYTERTTYKYDNAERLIDKIYTIDFEHDGQVDYKEESHYCLIFENLPSILFCPSDTVLFSNNGQCGVRYDYGQPLFSDEEDGDNLQGILLEGDTSGAIFPIGTTSVSYVYTDSDGNGPIICTFSVEVIDNLPPQIVNCPLDITTCDLNYGKNNLPFLEVNDNCAIVQIDTIFSPDSSFSPGSTTNVEIIYSDASGNVNICSFDVHKLSGEIPQITSVPIPFGCQGQAILTSTPDNAAYLWSNGGIEQSTLALFPGIYQVEVTDDNGCSRVAVDTISADYESMSALISSYTLLAEYNIDLNETEVYGGVGSANTGSKITMDQNSNIWGFTKSEELEVKNGSSINGILSAPFWGNPISVPVPFSLPEIPVHPYVFTLEHDIKIKKNQTVIIDGNNCQYALSQNCSYFDNLNLSDNSTLIIRNLSSIRFKKITTKNNARILFEQNTDVYVTENVAINDNNYIGPDPNIIQPITVNFYVEEKLEIDKGSEFVANSIANHIHIKDATIDQRTIMTGYYISKNDINSDKYVTWETNTECGISLNQFQSPMFFQKYQSPINIAQNKLFEFNIFPNPAQDYTTIKFEKVISNGQLKIFDDSGRFIYSTQIKDLDMLSINITSLIDGFYFMEITADGLVNTKSLIKMK